MKIVFQAIYLSPVIFYNKNMKKQNQIRAAKKTKPQREAIDITALEEQLGYEFADKQLLKKALTHRSFSADCNERLEFLGDAVLELVISEYLHQNYPHMNEGDLSCIRANLVSKPSLVVCGNKLALFDYVLLGYSEHKGTNERSQSSVIANALEAIIGAVYLDGGLIPCRTLILFLFGNRLHNLTTQQNFKDAKSTLQELVQAEHHIVPVYELITTHGKPHKQLFTVICLVPNISKKFTGKGKSRKEAEQIAAQSALEYIKNHGA